VLDLTPFLCERLIPMECGPQLVLAASLLGVVQHSCHQHDVLLSASIAGCIPVADVMMCKVGLPGRHRLEQQ
jgi:hypothetical protein